MKSKKRQMLDFLMTCDVAYIEKSFDNPNKYMTKFDLLIHKLALRNKGVENEKT